MLPHTTTQRLLNIHTLSVLHLWRLIRAVHDLNDTRVFDILLVIHFKGKHITACQIWLRYFQLLQYICAILIFCDILMVSPHTHQPCCV